MSCRPHGRTTDTPGGCFKDRASAHLPPAPTTATAPRARSSIGSAQAESKRAAIVRLRFSGNAHEKAIARSAITLSATTGPFCERSMTHLSACSGRLTSRSRPRSPVGPRSTWPAGHACIGQSGRSSIRSAETKPSDRGSPRLDRTVRAERRDRARAMRAGRLRRQRQLARHATAFKATTLVTWCPRLCGRQVMAAITDPGRGDGSPTRFGRSAVLDRDLRGLETIEQVAVPTCDRTPPDWDVGTRPAAGRFLHAPPQKRSPAIAARFESVRTDVVASGGRGVPIRDAIQATSSVIDARAPAASNSWSATAAVRSVQTEPGARAHATRSGTRGRGAAACRYVTSST